MTSLRFRNLQCHDDRPGLSRQDGIERTLGFAGIHDYSALGWIEEAFTSSTSSISDANLEGSESSTWSILGNRLYGSPPDGAQWYKVRHETETEVGYTVEFDKTGDEGGFLFMASDSYVGYIVWWTGTLVGVSSIDGTTETVLISIPSTETGAATVRIAIYPRSYSNIDVVDDVAVGLWFDGKMLLTYIVSFDTAVLGTLATARKKIGFVARNTSCTYEDLRIPQLRHVQEWTSVDPGETAAASLGRVVGKDNVRVQARYDGTVKIWRNEATSIDWAIDLSRPTRADERYRHYSVSHLRLVGAVHETDTFRDTNQGHIFAVAQDPNALTETDTYDKGTRRHREGEESADVLVLTIQPNLILESGDVISYNGGSWRVESIAYKIGIQSGPGGQAPVLASSISCRKVLTS